MASTPTNDASKQPKRQAPRSGLLILVRHTESEWNVLGKWTGRTDVHLTKKGQEDARLVGKLLRGIDLHHAYASEQVRTLETLTHILETAQKADTPKVRNAALNERDYGEYTGLNKWEVLDQLGQDVFTKIRRSWDHPIPGGETLEMVHGRTVPFYMEHIMPKLRAGKNVLVVSHGNTLRSLIKYLEDISDEGISEVEMPFGHALLYHINEEGKHEHKEVRMIASEKAPSA